MTAKFHRLNPALVCLMTVVAARDARTDLMPQTGQRPARAATGPRRPVALPGEEQVWTSSFPRNMGIFSVAGDVKDPTTAYACSINGLYRTRDGGVTWDLVLQQRAAMMSLSQSRLSPNVLYLGSGEAFGRNGKVWRSEDSGVTWTSIGEGTITEGVSQVLVDPASASAVYAITGTTLIKSQNFGKSWAKLESNIALVSADPSTPGRLLAIGENGLRQLRSDDGGLTWSQILGQYSIANFGDRGKKGTFKTGFGLSPSWSLLLVHPRRPRLWFGVLQDRYALVRSMDGGASWEDVRPTDVGTRSPHILALEFDGASDEALWVATSGGLFASQDAGTTWRRLISAPVDTVARTSALLLAVGEWGASASSDDGASWQPANFGLPNLPIDTPPRGELYPKRFHLGTVDSRGTILVGGPGGYWRSEAGGVSWSWQALGEREVVGVSATVDGTKYFQGASGLPGAQVSSYSSIRESADGQRTPIRSEQIPKILLAPESASGRLYLASKGDLNDSLFTSEDSGFSWTPVDLRRWLNPATVDGFNYLSIAALEAAPGAPQSLAVLLTLTTSPKSRTALLLSDDSGVSFRDVSAGLFGGLVANPLQLDGPLGRPVGLAMAPNSARTLYVAFESGVMSSTDGGGTWRILAPPPSGSTVSAFAVDRADGTRIFWATRESMFVGEARGRWTKLNRGLEGDSVFRVIARGEHVWCQGYLGIYRLSTSDRAWIKDGLTTLRSQRITPSPTGQTRESGSAGVPSRTCWFSEALTR